MSTPVVLRRIAREYAHMSDAEALDNVLRRAPSEGLQPDRDDILEALEAVRLEPNGTGPHMDADAPRQEDGEPVPLFDPVTCRFSRFLNSEPPERRMLIPEFLPLGVVGLVASMGGAGKSVLLYQLALSSAAGVPFLGMTMDEAGGVLYVAAEDDEHELHRRGHAILQHYEGEHLVDRGAAGERLHVVSRVADDNMLTRGVEGSVSRTALVRQLVAAARQIPDLKLIALDPVSRFRGGRANAEEDTTRFVEVLETLRSETGATVLAAVHVNKASMAAGNDADQAAVRGSTALVDGVRWVAQMLRLRASDAGSYGIPAAEAGRYVRLDLVKANYVRPWPGMWLRREAGGILVPADLERQEAEARQARNDERHQQIIARVLELLADTGPMTLTRVLNDYAGATGRLAAGKDAVRASVRRALDEGSLQTEPDPAGRGGELLRAS